MDNKIQMVGNFQVISLNMLVIKSLRPSLRVFSDYQANAQIWKWYCDLTISLKENLSTLLVGNTIIL